MCSNYFKASVKAAILAVTILLLMAGVSSAQTAATVSLTASQQTVTMPDGAIVPMFGWTCGDSATTVVASVNATCTALTYTTGTGVAATTQKQLGGTFWQPPLIVVQYNPLGTTLAITLNNSLPVETSIMILGQVGGGLGGSNGFTAGTVASTGPVREAAPRSDGAHAGQTATTWTIVTPGSFTPPSQEQRVRSMVPEIAGVATVGATAASGTYTWGTATPAGGLKPGTYLIRTGTYPSIQGPMGLYGVLVVTTAPVAGGAAGTAYYPPTGAPTTAAGVTYDSDVVALESEIDPRQNRMVAALFSSATSGTACSATVTTGCVTAGPSGSTALAGTTGATAFDETKKWNIACGAGPNGLTSNGTVPYCYPPAVDYTPLYFLINGVAFSKDNQLASALEVPAPSTTAGRGNVLIRYVNAGSHMHVPVLNGLDSLLVAEDAFVDSDVALALGWSVGSSGTAPTPKTLSANLTTIPTPCTTAATVACGLHLRTDVFQPAGKVFDVLVSPAASTGTYVISDRSLALGTGGLANGSGMTAILDVADTGGAAVAAANATATVAGAAYTYVPGVTLTVSDPSKGVLKNDINVYGVQLVANQTGAGTLTLNANGTFTYFNAGSGGDTFSFYANGNTGLTGSVTFTAGALAGTVTAANDSYTSKSATLLRVATPGVLGNDSDSNNLPLCAVATAAASGPTLCPQAVQTISSSSGTAATISLNSDGSFTAQLTGTAPASGATATASFTYVAANSQGVASSPATVTLTFQGGSGLNVLVKDAVTGAQITDYKWIIEQDLTYPIDPACQVNTGTGTRPLKLNGQPCPAGIPPTPATNFHTSYMPVIAEGCTGPQSCEKGQTVYVPCISPGNPTNCGQHVAAACDGYGTCTIGALQLPASMPSSANLSASNPDGSPANYYISILSGDAQNSFAFANTKDPSVAGNCTPGSAAPGQTANPTTEPSGITEASACGHTMGGAPVLSAASFVGGTCTAATGTGGPGTTYNCTYPTPAAGTGNVTILLQPQPLPTATVTAFVFEDDYPLNGEPDTGGGIDALATLEVPLGDFQIQIWDDAGGNGDFTGQMTYDMFNMPLTNSLNGTIDPNTGFDACPIASTVNTGAGTSQTQTAAGMILVCPQFESDGKTPSPLTGQVVVRNLMMGKYSLIAHPGANREAKGEEWLQTNSLDGGHFLDSFIKPGEPPYFAEFGPGGYHVFFGFANPKHINARLAAICGGNLTAGGASTPFSLPCNNHLHGQVTNLHQNRPPDENLYTGGVFAQGAPGNYAPLGYTNCYAAIGDTDGATIALAKCDPDGNFAFDNLPAGDYGLVLFDQWNDFIVDGSSHQVHLAGGQTVTKMYPSFTWQAHLWSRIYMDTTGQGSPNLLPDGSLDPATSPGLIQVPTRIRGVNGKIVNTLLADVAGNMRFDETFPLFAFYTVESDNTRFRSTGVHVVNDNGGAVDGPTAGGGNGNTGPFQGILNSNESFSLPSDLSIPGAVYCPSGDAACLTATLVNNATGKASCGSPTQTSSCQSTGRIDPGRYDVEGWQGGVSEFNMIDWGKQPYYVSPTGAAENGGIRGRVVNNTTRNFDDIRMQIQNLWEPLVPRVQINLYAEGFATDGVTPTLTLVDSTKTDSFDDWAQGFRTTSTGAQIASSGGFVPNMSCTGQDTADPFFAYTMAGTQNLLNPPATAAGANTLPYNSQYKCYDGYHNLNQLQPAPYDGQFRFPSQVCATGTGATAPTFTATIGGSSTAVTYSCNTIVNPAFGATDPVTHAPQTGAAQRILPPGKYVVELVLPPGWQLDKEEDLNLLIGDQYIAPATSQFTGLGNIYITPDQASLDSINPSYTGPYTSATGVNGTSGPYTQPWNCAPNGGTCALTPGTTNNGKQSTDYGRSTFGVFAPGALQLQSAPCVGKMRIVPDYLSIAPESGEVAPFAGSLRPLCDRKEITLSNQMQADLEFNTYTHTPKTTSFTGFISDDFSSEFDPASPAFGEKFAVPNVPVSIRDFNGNEVSRVYSDQWGVFNGLVYSSWEVDPPNITGFSPNMMVTCMNDPGPFIDHRPTILNAAGTGTMPNPTYGQMITDPSWNPAYSTFCYENPFMPGDTTYLDTPVVPVSAFAEGYNPPDCSYPDGTPMILSVKGDPIGTGAGPWVGLGTGHNITICAFAPTTPAAAGSACPAVSAAGVQVPNNAYSGPAATTAPYNQKTVPRHYGFGTATGSVTIGGKTCTVGTWSDAMITCGVPDLTTGNTQVGNTATNSACFELPQTSASNGNLTTQAGCGELVITTGGANPRKSIDTVTVSQFAATTIGGKHNPAFVAGEDSTGHALQNAIDNANSGDLIVVGCAAGQSSCTYNEMLLMWKPLRLQGIGDGAVTINANVHPAGKLLEPWRRQVNCLFGLALNGGVVTQGNPYDPNNQFTCTTTMAGQVDAVVGEPTLGWDATLNGNLAELLQEPTLMGAYEGAGITVLAKGLENGGPNSTTCTVENAAACVPLNNGRNATGANSDCYYRSTFYPSNFLCNPSRIDGLTFTNSSQGGGGVYLHAWNHHMQVSNLNVTSNGGTLTGGITVGQMETVDPTTATVTIGSGTSAVTGTIQLALGYNQNVNIHNNRVTNNAAYGDELNSNTPASAGGVTICTGSDYYNFNNNWVCGNWASGDGGGVAHHGFSWNGTIQNNWILFNQSINPSLVTNGGGLVVHGHAPDGTLGEAGTAGDVDVAPALTAGIGPGLMIRNNVFQGNTAEEGQGGGISLMHINGNDILNNQTHAGACGATANGTNQPVGSGELWYCVMVVNNLIANNVAGWTGGGVSLLDAVLVNFHNNTVVSNDSTASAGVVFNSNGAPLGNVPPPGCNPQNFGCTGGAPFTSSVPLPAGLVTEKHSQNLSTAFTTASPCPPGHDTNPATNACTGFSIPSLDSDIFWENRSFSIATNASNGTNAVVLSPNLQQTNTGSCPVEPAFSSSSGGYWDVGVYGDTTPASAASGNPRLTITNSTLSSGGYTGTGDNTTNPGFPHQYCNGSRVAPEIATLLCTNASGTGNANAPGCIRPGAVGLSTWGGVPDSAVPPNPLFSISPAATIDEGNNWINMFYGPLSLTCAITAGCGTGTAFNAPLGVYSTTSGRGAAGLAVAAAQGGNAQGQNGNGNGQGQNGTAGRGANLPPPYPNP